MSSRRTGKPGMIIGRGGAGIEALKTEVTNFLGRPCHINVMEIKSPDTDAQLVAENIAQQLEKRFRQSPEAVYSALLSTLLADAKSGEKETSSQ